MKIILLSGGSGKRLWPLSNDVRSKQFLKLLPTPCGGVESMIQRVVRQIRSSAITDSITIATGAMQLDPIRSQLGADVQVVTEPTRRDTFPAIALASIALFEKGTPASEPIVVMPCDVFTEEGYFRAIARMCRAIEQNVAQLTLMGIKPTGPSTQYGYIVPQVAPSSSSSVGEEPVAFSVSKFVEKPNTREAEELIAGGAMWNGGVFAFRLQYMLDIVKRYSQATTYAELREHFEELPKISFDYEVVEKATSVAVVPFAGEWKDLGTWDALTRQLPKEYTGYVVNAPNVRNTHVVNELDIPIVCVGVDNLIISASPDGILIADKSSSDSIKEQVSIINARPMFEERRWGFYKVLGHTEHSDGYRSLTKLLHLNPGCSISYQIHALRDEVWTFVDGEALLVIDGKVSKVGRGHIAHIRAGQRHAVKALTDIEIIEVQSGSELIEEDITRLDWDWTPYE